MFNSYNTILLNCHISFNSGSWEVPINTLYPLLRRHFSVHSNHPYPNLYIAKYSFLFLSIKVLPLYLYFVHAIQSSSNLKENVSSTILIVFLFLLFMNSFDFSLKSFQISFLLYSENSEDGSLYWGSEWRIQRVMRESDIDRISKSRPLACISNMTKYGER